MSHDLMARARDYAGDSAITSGERGVSRWE